jgi:hypothetical protein
MQKFEMPFDNTCTDCGKLIAKDKAVFAENFDQVLSGLGRCLACNRKIVKEEKAKEKEVEKPEFEDEEPKADEAEALASEVEEQEVEEAPEA